MSTYSLSHLADQTLVRELKLLVTQDRATTAALLAHLAEVDERKLYLPASYPSMFMYCVRELRMSEDVAFKRIRAARAGRRFPPIFPALADGRLHVSAVVLLAPYLRTDNAAELLQAAEHKTKAEVELQVAERFPRPDVPTVVRLIAGPVASDQLATWPVHELATRRAPGPVPEHTLQLATQLAPGPVDQHTLQLATQLAPGPVDRAIEPSASVQIEPVAPRAKITPISPGKFAMQLTIDKETQAQLVYAQALLGHAVPSGDVAQVLKRALDALVQQLEQKRFAKCARSGKRRGGADGRYVPAEIRRAVWQRDGGQCTFVSASGKRCEERTRLEFDHVDPRARGGQTLTSKLKLKCRAHNQYAAECAFGAEFMREKRLQARFRTGQQKAHVTVGERSQGQAPAQAITLVQSRAMTEQTQHDDIIPWLRQLGFSAEEARRGAAQCAHMQDASLEQRVRIALRSLAPNCVRRAAHVASSSESCRHPDIF